MMHRLAKKFSLLGILLVLAVFVPAGRAAVAPQATTYYVATTGNNTNPGTLASPWATIQYAVDHIAPGDTIQVLAGTYLGARITSSGNASAWKTLQAAPGAQVLINAPGPQNAHQSDLELEDWEGAIAYWKIEGLEVSNAPGWGIDVRGSDTDKAHHISILGNRVHHNGTAGTRTGIFAAFTDYVLIQGNESYNNTEHGIYVNNSSDYFTLRGNRVHHNANCGIHLNGDLSMGGDGILSGGLIENNVIYENGTGGGAGINMDGVTTTTLRNNLLYNNHATGIAVFQIDGGTCSHDNEILHNTILMASNGRWALLIADPACSNNHLFNNIFYSYHSYRGSLNLAGGSPAGFQSDYNVVMDRFTTDDGDSILTLGQWQALGYDAHSFLATDTALFANPGSNDYHLKTGSPAINQGISLPSVTTDLEGHLRPAGAGYDIGAYEYQEIVWTAWVYLPLLRR